MNVLDDQLMFSDWQNMSSFGGQVRSLFLARPFSGAHSALRSTASGRQWSGWGGFGCSFFGREEEEEVEPWWDDNIWY